MHYMHYTYGVEEPAHGRASIKNNLAVYHPHFSQTTVACVTRVMLLVRAAEAAEGSRLQKSEDRGQTSAGILGCNKASPCRVSMHAEYNLK